jgi:hypothetical protein
MNENTNTTPPHADEPIPPHSHLPWETTPHLEDAAVAPAAPAAEPALEVDGGGQDELQEECENSTPLTEYLSSFTAISCRHEFWDWLERSSSLRFEFPLAEVADRVRDEFGEEEAIRIRLCERVDGEVRAASWTEMEGPWFLEVDDQARAFRIHTEREYLFPVDESAFGCALQRRPPESSVSPGDLYVTASSGDAEVIRHLGLQAVTIEGLSDLTGQQWASMFGRGVDIGWRHHLVLLDFDVALLRNERTAGVAELVARLAEVERVYAIDPRDRFSVLRPSDDEFELLITTIRFQDRDKCRQMFERWAASAKTEIETPWSAMLSEPDDTLSGALADLRAALSGRGEPFRARKIKSALHTLRDVAHRTLVQPLLEQADAAPNILSKFRSLELAEHAEKWLETHPLVCAARAELDEPDADPHELDERSTKARQQCLANFSRLRRELAKHPSR